MAEERPAAAAPAPTGTAQIAKAALRRLALSRLEPTPENYARAWAEEGGTVPPMPLPERLRPTIERLVARVAEDGGVASELVRRVMKGEWTLACLDGDPAGCLKSCACAFSREVLNFAPR